MNSLCDLSDRRRPHPSIDIDEREQLSASGEIYGRFIGSRRGFGGSDDRPQGMLVARTCR